MDTVGHRARYSREQDRQRMTAQNSRSRGGRKAWSKLYEDKSCGWKAQTRGQHFKGLLVLFHRSVMSNSLQPHGRQHARLPCPSPSPGVCSAHVHWVSDAIQPSHPLSPPSPPALNLSQHQGHFQRETEIVLICLLLFHFYQKKKKKRRELKGEERKKKRRRK